MKTKLNLIPEYKKEEIRQKSIVLKISRWLAEFTSVLAIFVALLFSIGYILKLDLLTNEIKLSPNNISKFKEFKQYDSEIKNINAQIKELQRIQGGELYWSNFFAKMSDLVPDGVVINGMGNKDYAIAIAGNADMRDNLVAFKTKLEADSCFTDVNLPLSYLTEKENLSFQINFNIKKECLAQSNGK